MGASVGELVMAVRAPREPGVAWQAESERFTRRVLESVADRLAVRWPDRVILVRELEMKWRLSADAITRDDEVAAVAAEVTTAVADLVEQSAGEERPGAQVAVFADRASYLCACWETLAQSNERDLWWLGDASSGGASEAPDTIVAALNLLWLRGRLPAVLPMLPPEWFRRIADVTDAAPIVSAPRPTSDPVTALAAVGASLPSSFDETAAAICLAVAAAVVLPSLTADERANAVRATLSWWTRALPHASPPTATAQEALAPSDDAASEDKPTRYGSIVFLLSLAIELDAGEILWRACLPEGEAFRAALLLLLGDAAADDALVNALGGELRAELRVELAQQQEVAVQLLRAFVRAATRRGKTIPPLRLRLWHRSGERFLVACSEDAFPCFVWPADSAAALTSGIATFLQHWPWRSARPEAAPGLATFDRAGRVLVAFDHEPGGSSFLPDRGSAPRAALVTQVAGTLGALFSARLRADPPLDRATLVSHYLGVPGHVRLSPRRLDVLMPAERAEIAVRLAGLDRDPGWVAWLERTVRVAFVDAHVAP